MVEVILHVYDVTSSMNVRANSMIMNINKVMRDGIGIGGIFHSGVQVRVGSLLEQMNVSGQWEEGSE
jgi:hypothetical protein